MKTLFQSDDVLAPPEQPANLRLEQPVRLVAVRGLFVFGNRIEQGQEFQVQAQHAVEIVGTHRADFASPAEKAKVFKLTECW